MAFNEKNFRVNACAEVVRVFLEFKEKSLNSHYQYCLNGRTWISI